MMDPMRNLLDRLEKLQRPDETDQQWSERTGIKSQEEYLESLDPFKAFRTEQNR